MTANAPLADKIKLAVATGNQPDISVGDLLQQPSRLRGAMHVTIIEIDDLPLLGNIYQIACLLPGLPIGQWIPKEDVLANLQANNVAQLKTVTFSVDDTAKEIVSIALSLTLGSPSAPVTLTAGPVSATVTQLTVTLYPKILSATVIDLAGNLTLGSLKLNTTLSCPSLAFSAAIPRTGVVHFSDLTSSFGLPTPSGFDDLIVSELDLAFNAREQTASLSAGVRTADGQPLTIIPDVLGLDELDINLNHAPSSTDITLNATLTVRKTIVLGVLVSGGTKQDWMITGAMDVAETAANFHSDKVTIANLLDGALGVTLPPAFNFLTGVELVTLDGTVALGSKRSWSLDVAVDVDWDLAGTAFTANTTVQVGNDGTNKTGSVKADLRIGDTDGPGLSLQVDYECATAGNSIHVNIPQLQLETDYTIGTEQLTITFDHQSLGDLVGDFASIFTGNPYVELPSPWSDILNAVSLPATVLTVDLKTKAVTIRCNKTIDFFGNDITGVGLGYDPAKPAGDRVSFTIYGNFPVLGGLTDPSWDPGQPGDAPAVPGEGSKLIDIKMVAAGQYVELKVDDSSTVETVLSAIATIATNAGGSDPDKLPTFTPDAGWLVATHMVFKGAVDFQFVFADPVIYGAVVKVTKQSDSSPAIVALDGLYAEILYRKVTSSIGVYEGMLTLPDAVRNIDYGAFQLQLPSIAVNIYTNGDFLIDVGFPHNGDFSKSAVINAGEYVGAGGVYYGHLSGATASALPTVQQVNNRPIGTFNTVTEIGIGLRVGIGKSYSEGPLSASFSLVVQAIFEGIFSTYTQFPPIAQPSYPVTTEYYKIVASLGIVGQLEGSLDFVIVTASLLIEIQVVATVTAESYKAVQVEADVDVDVELSVRINLGLFSIHIHCSFSATVSFHTQFGSDAAFTPWSAPQQLSARHAAMLLADAPLQLNFRTPPCQGVATTLYAVPQLSRGLTDIATPTGPVDWVYTLQFALPTGLPAPQGTFADFAKFVTAWAVDAAWPHQGTPTTPDDFYGSLTIDVAALDTLIDALKAIPRDSGSAVRFDAALASFFAQNRFTLAAITADNMSLGFFPVLPPLVLTCTGGQTIPGIDGVANEVLRAYALLVATTVLNFVKKAKADGSTLLAFYQALGTDGINQAVGMATRFMLHGTRHTAPGGQLVPLYRATGQDMSIDLDAATLSVTVAGPTAAAWGVSVPQGGLVLSSAGPQNTLHAPADIKTYVAGVTTAGLSAQTMPSMVKAPVHFAVRQGVVANPSLRGLPRALLSYTGATTGFAVYDDHDVAVPTTAWDWAATADFRVQKVPDASTPGAYLADVYNLVAVRSDGLDRLEALYKACNGTANFGKLEIAYGVDANQTTSGDAPSPTFVDVAPGKVFLFQSNISTETNPPALKLMMAAGSAAAVDPGLTFLARLMTGGLTNSGGYYLYLKLDTPPDPALFDARGMAWLTLVVSKFSDTSGAIAPYLSALRISDQTYAGPVGLTIHSPNLQAPQATLAPGIVGVQINRPDWSKEDDSHYQLSLDGLFNLIDCEPAAFQSLPSGAHWPVVPGNGKVVGPIKTSATTDTLHIYRAQFDLLKTIGQQPDIYPNPPSDAANPYQFTGAQLQLDFGWVDFYGNTLPPGFTGAPLAIGLVDPLLGLDDWPGLSYGFGVSTVAGVPQLTVSMTFIPVIDKKPVDEPTYRQYVKIYHQLKTATVTAQASFVKSALAMPVIPISASDILRANIVTILKATTATNLTPLTFPLPQPVSAAAYRDDLLQQLVVSLGFVRPGPVAAGLEVAGDNPILTKTTVLAPFQTKAAPQAKPAAGAPPPPPRTPLSYLDFATNLEQTLAPLGIRVMGGDLDVPGGAQFWLLRWQGAGLQIGLQPGGMGFAPTPIATALQSRNDIAPALFSAYNFPSDYFINATLAVTSIDMDALLGELLTAIESFLSPAYAIPAAIAAPDQVDLCIAYKQTLAQLLAGRVVALADQAADAGLLAAAKTKYQEACLLDLRNFYAVDAAASLKLTVATPTGQTPPDLIVYGHASLAQASDVVVSAGQSRIDATGGTMAMSLSARHKDWHASFQLPGSFRVEALELVDGSLIVTDPDEPAGQPRTYVTGTWLRFITDGDLDLTLASPPTIQLPLRSYPPTPTLMAQGYSQIGGTQLDSVKSWSLDCTYRHQFAAQDTVHITAVLNEPPPTSKFLAETRPLDLLDGLVLFQTVYPSIRTAFDNNLRMSATMPTPTQNTLDAIASFVLIVKCVTEHFNYAPSNDSATGGPPGIKFEMAEFFDGDDPGKANWQATLIKTADPTGLSPPPIVLIDQSTGDQPSSGETVYRGVPVEDPITADRFNITHFVNDSQQVLLAQDALGNPNRSLQIQPLDIVDWHNGRYYLQIIRNQTMPKDFRYVTSVVAAKDRVLPFIDNSDAEVDLFQLPAVTYGPNGPKANSFGDILARLYHALLNGEMAKPVLQPGGMRIEISLSYPLIPASVDASDPIRLPDVRLPVALQLTTPGFTFYPTPDQAWAMAQPMAANVVTWLQSNGVVGSQRPDLHAKAKLDVTVTVFSAISEISLPMIYIDGLYVNCSALAD